MTRKLCAAVLELAGFAAVVVGAAQLAVWLGWIVGGALAVVVALHLDGATRQPR